MSGVKWSCPSGCVRGGFHRTVRTEQEQLVSAEGEVLGVTGAVDSEACGLVTCSVCGAPAVEKRVGDPSVEERRITRGYKNLLSMADGICTLDDCDVGDLVSTCDLNRLEGFESAEDWRSLVSLSRRIFKMGIHARNLGHMADKVLREVEAHCDRVGHGREARAEMHQSRKDCGHEVAWELEWLNMEDPCAALPRTDNQRRTKNHGLHGHDAAQAAGTEGTCAPGDAMSSSDDAPDCCECGQELNDNKQCVFCDAREMYDAHLSKGDK